MKRRNLTPPPLQATSIEEYRKLRQEHPHAKIRLIFKHQQLVLKFKELPHATDQTSN